MKPNKLELSLLAFLFFHLLLGMVVSFTHLEHFENSYTVEDGVMEWYTVDALLMCSALCGYRLWRLRRSRSPLFLGVLGLLTLLFFFGAGEEISWGQRLFGVESSEFFAENNAQGETNLHNLVVGDTKVNKVVFSKLLGAFILTYILIFPVLYAKIGKIRELAHMFAVPVPQVRHVAAYLVVGSAELIVQSSKRGELLEFGGCFMFLIILLFPKNREIFEEEPQEL